MRRRCPAHHWHTETKTQQRHVGADLTVERSLSNSECCLCHATTSDEEYRVWQGEDVRNVVRLPGKKLWRLAEQEGQ